MQHGGDPYSSGSVHVLPLILRGLAWLFTPEDISQVSAILFPVSGVSATAVPLRITAFFGAVDALSALFVFIMACGNQRGRLSKGVLASSSLFPVVVAACFVFNPLSIVECVAMSIDTITTMLVLASVAAACWNLPIISGVFLAFVSTAALYPVVLILPMAVLIWKAPFSAVEPDSKDGSVPLRVVRTGLFVSTSVVGIMGWFYLCNMVEGGSEIWVREVDIFLFFAPDHTPNIGLWWDLLLEIFPQFTFLFLYVLQTLFFAAYPFVVAMRLGKLPLAGVWVLVSGWAILTPYPSLSHVALQMTLYCVVVATYLHSGFYKTIELKLLRNIVLVAAVLIVLMANATRGWLFTGTGNVNFYYAGVLVLQLTQTYWVASTLESLLRDAYLLRHPPTGTQHEKDE